VLERVNVPSYVIDRTGVIRWVNSAAVQLVGDVRGKQFTSVVAPEDRRHAQDVFARKVAGTAVVTDAEVALIDSDGDRLVVEVSSCPLHRGEQMIGVFGQMKSRLEHPSAPGSSGAHTSPDPSAPPPRTGPLDEADRRRAAPEPGDGAEPHPSPDEDARSALEARSGCDRAV
jgi:PAS domain S-box-containing protein